MARESDRKFVTIKGHMKTARGRQDVAISDLSMTGCKIESLYLSVVVGETIFLRVEGIEGRSCTIVWATERSAGIKFDQPFHPAVFDNLCQIHRT
jgi:hypothetical protein